MTEFSAHALTRTILCAYPGCPRDAHTGTTTCREHQGAVPPQQRPLHELRREHVAKGVARTEILSLLERGPRTPSEISAWRGVTKDSTLCALRAMVDLGLVERTSRGVYALPVERDAA